MGSTFVTSTGVTLEFLPIPLLIEKMREQHPLPEPPTYEVETAGGAKELHPHDTTTLTTDEERAAWADYQARLAEATADDNLRFMRLVMLRGIKFDLPPTDDWIEAQAYIGLTVPTDPLNRRIHWLETEALATKEDYVALLRGVMGASEVPEEVIRAAENSFRGQVGSNGAAGLSDPRVAKLESLRRIRKGADRHSKRHPAHK